ncbi:hypothetical protein Kpol_2000p25 [Vanderwaltozyma polyspora DSM 70294]|uniref:Mitochondrial dicarboxylate transporter n=1 Tax=Vanderwaltozyma polyspora (strain ATCC 22028 / DSM 70294 / BCRC 21397 / CBS 2163 / NBRC 10782 / NRRL Y-8283 / UCD 57-17) TaxID=436907 RepID=A7TF36_VANPO|nr:uncharacterized protein Kpol_2000p25 [Vanderwaltozyma polyspora DSM 70294]EDO19061.1 hypothetical protein Kpol_2000p25 [Vanderwaltozyma polyspora DSM 70294]
MSKESSEPIKYPWWYGGVGGIVATMCTHPLDLSKVRLQTSPLPRPSLFTMFSTILRNEGVVGLYSGLSAAILRQCTYTTARFGCYDVLKEYVIPKDKLNDVSYLLPASMVSGAIGGLVGNPADVVNIRMQNDTSLEPHLRRNYKNAIDGLIKIYKYDGGIPRLYAGLSPNLIRGILMTSSQVVTYDLFKNYLVTNLNMNPQEKKTHFTASLMAGFIATTVCSPADVMKTRIMNDHNPKHSAMKTLILAVQNEGPQFMFRGWLPSFVRLGPFTVLIFLTVEQMKKYKVGM